MLINISIDVEKDLHTNSYKGVTEGLKRLEKILGKLKIKPTLFVTGDCLEKFPDIFKALDKKGWEIASHSYQHRRMDILTEEKILEDVLKVKKIFKKTKLKITGYRAPQYSGNKKLINILAKKGFKYDSSIASHNILQLLLFPKRVNLWSLQFFKPNTPYKERITEIPLTSVLFPISGFALRTLPLPLFKLLFRLANKEIVTIAFHSWDFIETSKSKIYNICKLNKFIIKFEKFITYALKYGKFKTLGEFVNE